MYKCLTCGKEFKQQGNHPQTHLPSGFIPWNKGGGCYRPESLAKMSASQKARFERMPATNKGIPHTERTKMRIGVANRGKKIHMTEETNRRRKAKLSEARKGKSRPPHIGQVTTEMNRRIFSDPIKREARLREMGEGMLSRPTSIEKRFMDLCQKYNLPFRYVGNGEIWIARRNPDFINTDGKKQLVEILGTYWHSLEETQERINHYAKYGFECIALWEDELKDENLVLSKLGYDNDSSNRI